MTTDVYMSNFGMAVAMTLNHMPILVKFHQFPLNMFSAVVTVAKMRMIWFMYIGKLFYRYINTCDNKLLTPKMTVCTTHEVSNVKITVLTIGPTNGCKMQGYLMSFAKWTKVLTRDPRVLTLC